MFVWFWVLGCFAFGAALVCALVESARRDCFGGLSCNVTLSSAVAPRLRGKVRGDPEAPLRSDVLVGLVIQDRLVGLVVKASASRVEDPGFESRLGRDFSGVESCQ